MAGLCGWASIDENGRAKGGAAGDQTGKEVKTGAWYNFGQKYVIRYKDRTKAHKHAVALKKLCNANYVGYDQNQRGTLLTEAKKVGYSVDSIKTKCETDCSALQCTCAIIAGAKNISLWATGSMLTGFDGKSGFKYNSDFEILTDSKYLTSGDYLLEGDISVAPGHHTIGTIENGSKAGGTSTSTSTTSSSTSSGTSTTLCPIKATVTASALNIRAAADVNSAIKGSYKNGEVVTITSVSGKWGKTSKGWISLNYCSYTVKVTASALNIRADHTTSSAKSGTYANGEKVTIIETYNGWGKTKKGWISLSYVKLV